jgi:glycosyltransferase involved in cell wall biosynthesis
MSIAYAARNAWARTSGIVHKAVSVYACPTRFVADLLIEAGYPSDRVRVVYNYCDLPPAPKRTSQGSYIGYLGRISPEKGVNVLIDAARRSGIPTRIAGDASPMPELSANLPANVHFVGKLDRQEIDAFLSDMRALVVPSVWYEVFGLVCVEALSRGIPVIASDIGGLPEVVHHERTGLLVPANDPIALAGAMQTLWDQPQLAAEYGLAGQEVVKRLFSPDTFYRQMRELWSDLCAPVEIPSTRVPTPTLSATLKQSM